MDAAIGSVDTTIWWRRLARNRLLDAAALGIAAMVVVWIATELPERSRTIDFAHYYASSRVLVEGGNPYTTPLASLFDRWGFVYFEDIPFGTNPPPLLWLFAPFALLLPRAAYVTWLVVQVVSLIWLLWLTRRLLADRLSARGFRFVCAATVASTAVFVHFYYSQVQLLLAAITLSAYALLRAGQGTPACLLVTLAGLTKLFPLVLVPWFLWRSEGNVRQRLTRCVITALFAAGIVWATGLGLWRDFAQHGMEVVKTFAVNRTTNFSLPSFITNFGFARSDFMPTEDVGRLWWTVGTLVGIAVIGLVFVVIPGSKQNHETEFCLLTVAMLVGGITTWPHYFVFLVFPVTVAALIVAATPSLLRVVLFGLLLFALNSLTEKAGPFLDHHIYLKIVANYIPLFGLLALGWFFASQLRPAKAQEP
jgi:hypothetical protein